MTSRRAASSGAVVPRHDLPAGRGWVDAPVVPALDPAPSYRRERWHKRLTPSEYRRLVEVACRRLAGQSWVEIAAAMGWNMDTSAEHWAKYNIRRWSGDPWLRLP